MENLINESFSKNIYHFTDIASAKQEMKLNSFRMSSVAPGSNDDEINGNYFFYISFTTEKDITKGYPGKSNIALSKWNKKVVRFKFDGQLLNADGYQMLNADWGTMTVDKYLNIPKDSNNVTHKSIRNHIERLGLAQKSRKEMIDALSEFEERLVSNKTELKNVIKYVKFVDVLIDLSFVKSKNLNFVIKEFIDLPAEWISKLRFFTKVSDFNNETNYRTFDEIKPKNLFSKEDFLTKNEIEELKRENEKAVFSSNDLEKLSLAIYVMYYTNTGMSDIEKIARRNLLKHNLNMDVNIKYTERGSDVVKKQNLIDTIISNFGSASKYYEQLNDTEKFSRIFTIFKHFDSYTKNANFMFIALMGMYSEWLSKYMEQIKKKMSELKYQLITMNRKEFTDYIKTNIKLFKELLKDDPRFTSVAQILKKVPIIDLITKYVQLFSNKFYRYDEIIYFKRSVITLKNKKISQVRGTATRLGDLALMHNSADMANKSIHNLTESDINQLVKETIEKLVDRL